MDFKWDARKPWHDVHSLRERPEWVSGNYGAFPLYPWTMRGVGRLIQISGLEPVLANLTAGILISLLGTLGALFELESLGRKLFDARTGVLAAVYTEGLFLGLSFGALALIHGRKPGWASLLICGAVWTRSIGILLWIPLVLEVRIKPVEPTFPGTGLKRLAHRIQLPLRNPILGCLAIAGPLVSFAVWSALYGARYRMVQLRFHERAIFAPIASAREIGLKLNSFAQGGAWVHPHAQVYQALQFLLVGTALSSSLWLWRKNRTLAFYSLAMAMTPLLGGQFVSMARYLLSVPAVYLVPASVGARNWAFDRLWTIGSLFLLSLFGALFTFRLWIP